MTERTMSQMTIDTGRTSRTLRFWSEKELLNPRREGTKRFFSEGDFRRTQLIAEYQRLGFSIEEIRLKLLTNDLDVDITPDEATRKIKMQEVACKEARAAIEKLQRHLV